MDCIFDCCQNHKYSINTSINIERHLNKNENTISTNQLNSDNTTIGNLKTNERKKTEEDFAIINYPDLNNSETKYSFNYMDDLAKIRGKSIDTNNNESERNSEKNIENNKFFKNEYPKLNFFEGNRRKKLNENALGSTTTKENSNDNIHSIRNPKREMTINIYKKRFYSKIDENLFNDESKNDSKSENEYKNINFIRLNYAKENINRKNSHNKNYIVRKLSNENIKGDTNSILEITE
jgi:hypothetical protein